MVEDLASSSHARPLVGVGLDTSAGSPFVQDRLRLLGKTVFSLAFGFYVVINGILVAVGRVPLVPLLLTQTNVMHLLSAGVMGALWATTRARSWSLRALGAIDAGSLVLGGIGLALMAAQPPAEPLTNGLSALTVTMMARAILVPSTAARTFLVSWIAALPLLIVTLVFHDPTPGFLKLVLSVNMLLWLIIAVTLSTVASSTIYGLRQQAMEAADIGQYTLEEKIGSGGMGEVWRARHRMLIRPAAVKLVRPSPTGSSSGDPRVLLRRFEREARATAALKSPHTVQLYDFGVTDDGTLYYVMELLDGMDLETLVNRFGPLPAERAIYLLDQVCASLDDAHQNGLVHRDIKPANVVVGRLGAASDFVKVLDFGLVKLEGAARSEESVRLTADGNASGTPGFMAPEVALGDPTADHRVDLYSLGCVAYWLVTGKLVFEGPGAMKVMLAHAHTPPPAPSSRTELPIPPPFEALILECLEKDPQRRPPSATVLQARLRDIPVPSPWTPERAARWWSMHSPGGTAARPAADVLLSQEARPLRVMRQARRQRRS